MTVLIFLVAILLNHALDYFRIDSIVGVMNVHEIDSESFAVERFFIDVFGGEKCDILSERIVKLKEEIRKVGEDLSSYSRFSFFRRKDFDYLKRKYFLLELKFFSLVKELNSECGKPYLPVLFFYEIGDKASISQGFILQDVGKGFGDELVVLSLDKDYEDEPLIRLIKEYYNVTKAPTIIINNEKFEGLLYSNELKGILLKALRENGEK